MAEIRDGLGRALGRHHHLVAVPGAPGMAHREQAGGQRILSCQRPARMQVLRVLDQPVSRHVQRPLHRVEGVALARQDRVLEEVVQLLGERAAERREVDGAAGDGKLSQGHLVLRERARLVDAKDRGGPQRLDRRHPPREHVAARDPPGAQRQEDRQHDRELLGERGHGHRDAGEETLLPDVGAASAREREGHHHERAGHEPHDGEGADQAPGLLLQQGRLRLDLLAAPCRSCRALSAGPWPQSRRCPVRR